MEGKVNAKKKPERKKIHIIFIYCIKRLEEYMGKRDETDAYGSKGEENMYSLHNKQDHRRRSVSHISAQHLPAEESSSRSRVVWIS